ncbi:Phosphatidylinositide phosphatase SAC1 [Thoreauomyces humboldtii]|nr:Phosphatidylinositide phosphatase SAC1 [Thoreauomyces humboldtii]
MVYDTLNLYISSDSFTFEPVYVDPSVRRETLVIRREDCHIELNGAMGGLSGNASAKGDFVSSPLRLAPPISSLRQEEVISIYGLLGIIKLNAGDHIIVATSRERIGRIGHDDIYKLTGHKIIPVQRSRLHLQEQQIEDDVNYVVMLDALLGGGYFYFSNTFDITNTLQRQNALPIKTGPLWQRADERFYWNRYMHRRLIDYSAMQPDHDLSNFILPIMCGFIVIKHTAIDDKAFTFALLSRRSHHRAGPRYHSRGVDDNGNVSNFVETEQIIIAGDGSQTAYTQTRGSMPLYWTQTVNMRYQPKLDIHPNPKTGDSFKKHFQTQIALYGNQIVVNLINKKGYEQKLGEEFARQIGLLNDRAIRYVHFDFHEECKKMRWDRISLLLDDLKPELDAQGYFYKDPKGVVQRQQTSVVRTNCMDCLDRTNVVQSVLARTSLTNQLIQLYILPPNAKVQDATEVERMFKNVWADNADEVSRQYSGTGALKTDFTRGGKRTRKGALQDFRNSSVRYFKNNFLDGSRQDAFNLMLGVYEVNPTLASPFLHYEKPIRYLALPFSVIASVFMIMVIFLATPYSLSYRLLLTALCLAVLWASIKLVVLYGTDYVDTPRLLARIAADTATGQFETFEMSNLSDKGFSGSIPGQSAKVMPENVATFGRQKES